MSIAVIVFPGSNCEHDVVYALEDLGSAADLVWHRETDLSGFDGIVLPGGFAHGDYLRTGAIARFSPAMGEVRRLAAQGAPILGICNGFQILTEAGLLPGVLLANRDLRFICRPVHLRVESTESVLTRNAAVGDVLEIPLNSYEGNYTGAAGDGTTLLTYSDGTGAVEPHTNPNGSSGNIAGIANRRGNVAGLMPHPERAIEEALGSVDGRVLLGSFTAAVEEYGATRPARV